MSELRKAYEMAVKNGVTPRAVCIINPGERERERELENERNREKESDLGRD
jgi:hypothetical protein